MVEVHLDACQFHALFMMQKPMNYCIQELVVVVLTVRATPCALVTLLAEISQEKVRVMIINLCCAPLYNIYRGDTTKNL